MNPTLYLRKRSAISLLTKIANPGLNHKIPCIYAIPEISPGRNSTKKLLYHFTDSKIQPDVRNTLTTLHFHGTSNSMLAFSPVSISLTSILSSFQVNTQKDFPFPLDVHRNFILPTCYDRLEKIDSVEHESLEMPSQPIIEKHAARLIVIRKRKMKKHKLQKLRKKMKFEWAKVRQRREMRKEKAFQAVLIAQIKEAEKFDAAQYVAERLQKAQEIQIPRTWKGKRLPEFVIKEKLGIK